MRKFIHFSIKVEALILLVCAFFILHRRTVEEEKTQTAVETIEDRSQIALTFDDGPHPTVTQQVLDILEEKQVEASFFLVGEEVLAYPEIVQRMQEQGHLIGSHTYHHVQLNLLSDSEAIKEVNLANEAIYTVTGEYPEYLRPPYGEWKETLDEKTNMIEIEWNVDTLDWTGISCDQIVEKILKNAKDGAVVLMHDEYEETVKALGCVIDTLREKGYDFVTVDELIRE